MAQSVETVKPPLLYKETQELISEIESKHNTKLIAYWNSVNGNICPNDVTAFYENINKWEMQECIFLLVKSSGGHGMSSLRIVNLLRRRTKKLIVITLSDCASAATMLALGADEIWMGPLAYLTAVDTSLTHELSPVDKNNRLVSVSQDELSRVINLWNKENTNANPYASLYPYIHPLVFGAVDRASSLSIKLSSDILSLHLKDEKQVQEISQKLNSGYPAHNYPITLREAKSIGLNVKDLDEDLNDLFFQLNGLYSEMGKRAYTDFDKDNYHDNEIVNIIESKGCQVYYQQDKDWFYRNEERNWIVMNDNSNWYKITGNDKKIEPKVLQIR